MIPARQSTALELSIGPVLDADGVAVTGGVVGDFKIKKTTGNFAALNASATLTHVSAGTYDLVLTTSDTDTVGLCSIAIDDTTNACAPVYLQVMEEAVYDMLYAASATGYIANQPVDVNTIKTQTVTCSGGVTIPAATLASTTNITAGTMTTTTNLTNQPAGRVIPAGDIGDFAEDTAAVVLRFNTVGVTMAPITLAGTPAVSVYKDSTTQSTAGVTLTVDYDSVTGMHHVLIDTSADAFYEVGKSYTVVITTGTVSGVSVAGSVVGSFSIENRFAEVDVTKLNGGAQSLLDLKDFADDGYDPSTNKVQGVVLTDTVTTYTGNTPQTGDTYALANGASGFVAIKTQTAAIEVDTAEIGAAGAGLTNINLPNQTMDIVGNITGSLSGSVGSVTGAVGSVTGNVGGNVTGAVGSLAAQAKADVNAEVVDALATDTYAEPGQGAPAATTTLAAKIGYLYKAWRNRSTQTASEYALYADDATTKDQEAVCSDDNTTFDRGEIGTGA